MPLTAAMREKMFVAKARAGDARTLTTPLQKRPSPPTQLRAGDFAAVERQTDIFADELTADEFLCLLQAERRIRPKVCKGRSWTWAWRAIRRLVIESTAACAIEWRKAAQWSDLYRRIRRIALREPLFMSLTDCIMRVNKTCGCVAASGAGLAK